MDKDTTQSKGLGALISIPDNRSIALSSFMAADVNLPIIYRCDDGDIPVQNQLDKGTCVGQAEGGEIEYREKKDTGIVTPVSKRWLYNACKKVDGYPGEGTYPSVVASIKVNKGAPKEEFLNDDNTLPMAQYMIQPEDEQYLIDDAGLRIAKGYAYVNPNLEEVLQAIFQKGTVCATLMVGDWSQCPVKPSPSRGAHRVRLNGYERLTNGDAKIWFRNSWGHNWAKGVDNEGNGYFLWSDYKLNIFEMMVYTDVPQALILQARNTQYVFTRTLKYKMTGTDVIELQKRLAKEMASDGRPCYTYAPNGTPYFSTYFGRETEKAVQRYQFTHNIMKSGTPETTGYGQLGPTTRKHLNGLPIDVVELMPIVEDKKERLMKIMALFGMPIVITDAYRTFEEQDALYAQGRTKPGNIVTNAKGGESLHNYRVAFDVAFSTSKGVSWDGPWDKVGEVGKLLGLEWGGDWASFPDKPHFQYLAGYTLKDFQANQVDIKKFDLI